MIDIYELDGSAVEGDDRRSANGRGHGAPPRAVQRPATPSRGRPPGRRVLVIRLVGAFRVTTPDRVLTPAELGSHKARILLAVLAVERGRLVPVDRIIEFLWAADPPARAARNVAVLVSRLRAVLGAAAVTGSPAGYRLGDEVGVDVYDAARQVHDAELWTAAGEPARALEVARAARAVLASGEVMEWLPDADWAGAARAVRVTLLRRARHAEAAAALGVGDIGGALAAAEAAAGADPLDEAACRALMRAHAAAGEPARALAEYGRLRTALAVDLGLDPSPATREVHVAILRGAAVGAAGFPPAVPPVAEAEAGNFVGRDRDMSVLRQAWTGASAGGSRLLVVSGEAGIGKTRLVTELAREIPLSGGLVAQARCYRPARSLFLHPVVETLTQLAVRLSAEVVRGAADDRAGTLAALSPGLTGALRVPAVEPATPREPRGRVYDAVAAFVRRLSAARPLALIFDDLHHADQATVELLHYIARLPDAGRLLIVATVRIEEGQSIVDAVAGVARVHEVGPLDTAAIRRLAATAGCPAAAGDVERRTGGHTLFVTETLRALSTGHKGVPEGVREMVLHRVRRAGAPAEDLLRAAATVGSAFTPVDLARLLEISVPEAARRCERLLPTRLVVPVGAGYEFANDLTRRVLYDTTPQPTRLAYQ